MIDGRWGEQTAEQQLSETLPRRWAHARSVATEARRIAPVFDHGELLVAAAILQDIGYAPDLAITKFHQLDGARFLQAQDMPRGCVTPPPPAAGSCRRHCALVARHSCALKEAELRGCAADVAEFPDEETPLRDALWYCDMVTGPDGQRLTVEDQLAEIQTRYGPESLVSRFLDAVRPELVAAVDRTIKRYTTAGISQPRYG